MCDTFRDIHSPPTTRPTTDICVVPTVPYSLSKETLKKDLTEDPPSWILSAYGPGKDAPDQLWGGFPLEQSFEELRLHYMMGALSGNPQKAVRSRQDAGQSDNQTDITGL